MKLFSLRVPVALVLLLLVSGQTAIGQQLKVGYTDHEVIILNMPEYRDIQQQLQTAYQGDQQELQTMFQDFQERLDKYQKQQALLSEQKRAEREAELQDLQNQLQEAQANKEQALAEREAELMAPLLERVQGAIDQVSASKGLDIVLRTQVGVQPLILYVNKDTITDITPDVARVLGLDVDTAEN